MNKKQKYLLILGIVILILMVSITSFAFWQITKTQTEQDVVKTACFSIDFTGENDITLDHAYPMNDEELKSFLASATPYHFTITNNCNSLAETTINLESLNANKEKQLSDDWIDVILYENDYNLNLNAYKKLSANPNNDANKVIKESLHAYKLENITLKGNETKEYNLLLYMSQDTPLNDSTQNASWKSKITLSAEFTNDKFKRAGTLRKVSDGDYTNMWEYKDRITNLVIEDKLEDKTNVEGYELYGPFDESETTNESVRSYVMCSLENDECTGYLQGDGGIKLNQDSSYLFSNFFLLKQIEGTDNLDTSNVENMSFMFNYCQSLTSLDLSSWDTSKVTNMSYTFASLRLVEEGYEGGGDEGGDEGGADEVKDDLEVISLPIQSDSYTLDLSNWNTSNVTDMSSMFTDSNIKILNMKGLDLSNLKYEYASRLFYSDGALDTNIDYADLSYIKLPYTVTEMFSGLNINNLVMQNIDFSETEIMTHMFLGLRAENLDLSGTKFKFPEYDSASGMFIGTINNLNLSNTDFSTYNLSEGDEPLFAEVIDNYNEIYESAQINNIDISHAILPKNSFNFFAYITSDELTINLDGTVKSDVENKLGIESVERMFCADATTLNVENFKFPKESTSAFAGCSLSAINFINVDTSEVTDMSGMFWQMDNIKSLDLSGFDTSNVTNMFDMFNRMNNLESLNLSSFDTSKVENMKGMFAESGNLHEITYGSKFIHKPEADISEMFNNCPANKPDKNVDASWENVVWP